MEGEVEQSKAEPSLMSQTGRNAAYALGLALGFALLLSLAYTFMLLIADSVDRKPLDVWAIPRRILGFLQVTSVCAGPIVFLIGFALLQGYRLKYPRRSVE